MNEVEVPPMVEERACVSNESRIYDYPVSPHPNSLPYGIRVDGLNIGYVLNVGCQSIAVQNKEQLKKLICDYIDNPEEVAKKYTEGTLF